MASPDTVAPPSFYSRLSDANLAPLWEVLSSLVPPAPASQGAAIRWRYQDIRPLIREAGEVISAERAERRVLILENPVFRGQSRITSTLYAGLQLLLPGEIAPGHRHTQSALRFVIEGAGAYTAVDGERAIMRPGDLIVTPAWAWHDHGNEGTEPVVWLDCLDIPTVTHFGATFAEKAAGKSQLIQRPVGDSEARYGSNMLPADYRPGSLASPLFTYPYTRSRDCLERLKRAGPVDRCHGIRMKYVNPVTGGSPLPTITCFLQLLPEGFATAGYRSTDGTVCVVVEGRGRTAINDVWFDWNPGDVFVVPTWASVRHEAERESVLFSCSDREVQEKLGLWREERELPSAARDTA